jgi:hypothetical protein
MGHVLYCCCLIGWPSKDVCKMNTALSEDNLRFVNGDSVR